MGFHFGPTGPITSLLFPFMAIATVPSPATVSIASTKLPGFPSSVNHRPIPYSVSVTHRFLNQGQLTSADFASALEVCECPKHCAQIHAQVFKSGFGLDEFVGTKLLQLYRKVGCVGDAVYMFDKMTHRNLYSWKAILDVFVDNELIEKAWYYFLSMLEAKECGLEFFVFPTVLKICSGIGEVELGKQLHGMVVKYGFFENLYVGNALVDMYGKCGSLIGAKEVFAAMQEKDCVTWNSLVSACASNGMVHDSLNFLEMMLETENLTPNVVSWSAVISGFSQNGYDREAVELIFKMISAGVEPNARTLASVLPSCARLGSLGRGKEIHGYIVRHGFMTNSFVVNGLIDVYRKCSAMGIAFKIFSNYSAKNEVSFNTMIIGYSENGDTRNARYLFDEMEAFGVRKGIISWNSILSGYVNNCCFHEAWKIFVDIMVEENVEADSFTIGSILSACTDMGSFKQGKEIQAQAVIRGLHSDPYVGGALLELYCKWKDTRAARIAFDSVDEKDVSTWNALISGYARCNFIDEARHLLHQMNISGFEANTYTWNGIIAGSVVNGHHESALQLFMEMQTLFLKPDNFTVGIAISACSTLSTIHRGKQLHAFTVRNGVELDPHISVALLDMYAKCGSIKDSISVYNRIQNHDLVLQNAMLTAYAMHGYGNEGIDLFTEIISQGYVPDHITFLSVLTSCVHAGSVESGYQFFNMMRLYNVSPSLKHYTCLVDLLSRAGQLNRAYDLLNSMTCEPDAVAWNAFLGGCVIYRNVELGEIAAAKVMELEPDNPGHFVSLANLYASNGRWIEMGRIRKVMKDEGMRKKSVGCSWIESKDETHVFVASDMSHCRKDEIYAAVELLRFQMIDNQGNVCINVALLE